MNLLSKDEFLAWAAKLGIGPDPRYSPPQTLEYVSGLSTAASRGWFWGEDLIKLSTTKVVEAFLLALDPWDYCMAWKRHPQWSYYAAGEEETLLDDQLWAALVHEGMVPRGHEGAVRFDRGEIVRLGRLAWAHAMLAYCVSLDLFIVPNHGKQILYIDHHDQLIVRAPDADALDAFVQRLIAQGIKTDEDEL